jgi:hypothetical protein
MKIERKLDFEQKVFWVDADSKKEYGLLAAGVGWPGVKPGMIVIGGVSYEDPEIDGYPITILAEAGDNDLSGLLKIAMGFMDQFGVDRFIVENDQAMVQALDSWNSDRLIRGLRLFRVSQAEQGQEGKLLFTLQLVKRLTRPGRKLLTFGPDSTLPGYLLGLSPEEAAAARSIDHPPIVALGNCLSVLARWRPGKEPMGTKAVSDFDPLDI